MTLPASATIKFNVSDHLAARDWVTIGKAAPFAAEVHPVVPGFRTWQPSEKLRKSIRKFDSREHLRRRYPGSPVLRPTRLSSHNVATHR